MGDDGIMKQHKTHGLYEMPRHLAHPGRGSRVDEGQIMGRSGRWYRFEQHELMVRDFYVRASSLTEARRLVREHKSGPVDLMAALESSLSDATR